MRAANLDGHLGAALLVEDAHRRASVGPPSPAIAPAHQGDQHRQELPALLAQKVLMALGALLVGARREDPFTDEGRQAVGENVRRDAEVLLELAEPPDAVSDVPHDQRGPPLADYVERVGDRAG